MILRIYERVHSLNLNQQVVRVVRVFNHNIPSGITAVAFSQKGGLLVGTGAGTFLELPPGSPGEFVTPDPSTPTGLTYATPSVTINDTRNILINGGFDFAQRQAPGTLTTIADNAYGPDRWRVMRENDGVQYQRNDATGESGLTSRYYGKLKKTTGVGQISIAQIVEGANSIPLRGKQVIFQVKLKASTTVSCTLYLLELQNAGTMDSVPNLIGVWNPGGGGTPTWGSNISVISESAAEVTTGWQNFSVTGSVPTNSKNIICVILTNTNLAVNDEVMAAEAGLFLGNTQLGWSPRAVGDELRLCKRYYSKSYPVDTAPGTASVTGQVNNAAGTTALLRGRVAFSEEFYAAPTVTIYSFAGTINKASTIAGSDIGTTVTAGGVTQTALTNVSDSGSGFTAGTYYIYHWTAEKEL